MSPREPLTEALREVSIPQPPGGEERGGWVGQPDVTTHAVPARTHRGRPCEGTGGGGRVRSEG